MGEELEMVCEKPSGQNGSDNAAAQPGDRPFDSTALAWLVGEGIRHLHSSDKEGELAFQRVVELLSHSRSSVKTVIELSHRVAREDVSLRWSLIHLLGEFGDESSAEFLRQTAIEQLPAEEKRQVCESPRDGEVLIRTAAVQSLVRVASRHPAVQEMFLHLVADRPVRAVLIEAVKAAIELGLRDKVAQLLPEQDKWMLEIKRVRVQEIAADPERKDSGERGFTPPKSKCSTTTPVISCCSRTEK